MNWTPPKRSAATTPPAMFCRISSLRIRTRLTSAVRRPASRATTWSDTAKKNRNGMMNFWRAA
jgi:hypothetical protein